MELQILIQSHSLLSFSFNNDFLEIFFAEWLHRNKLKSVVLIEHMWESEKFR